MSKGLRSRMIEEVVKPGLKAGAYLPILRRHHVHLVAPGPGADRFVRLFAETWRRMPLDARRSILRHWKNPDSMRTGATFSPTIEVVKGWTGKRRSTMGGVYQKGHTIRFDSAVVGKMPDELVRDLIAHELAHVYQESMGTDIVAEIEAAGAWFVEEHADELAEDWGFSSTAIDDWSLAVGRTKVVDLATLTESQKKQMRADAKKSGRGAGLWL